MKFKQKTTEAIKLAGLKVLLLLGEYEKGFHHVRISRYPGIEESNRAESQKEARLQIDEDNARICFAIARIYQERKDKTSAEKYLTRAQQYAQTREANKEPISRVLFD